MIGRILAVSLLCVAVLAGSAAAAPWTFSSGTRAGTADFNVVGNDLVITLTNTSLFNTAEPSQLLSAVFFDVAGSPSLIPVSGLLTPGSVVVFGTTPADSVIGGEWAYSDSAGTLAPGGANYGVSATGLDIFGPFDRFPGPNLSGPENVGGMDYALLSAGNQPLVGNAPVTGGNPLILNSVTLTLDGLPAGFDPAADISNVWFQYGTDLDEEPSYLGTLIPEPLTMTATILGLGGLAGYMRKRTRRAA